jgi:hypothetical protein
MDVAADERFALLAFSVVLIGMVCASSKPNARRVARGHFALAGQESANLFPQNARLCSNPRGQIATALAGIEPGLQAHAR